MARGQTADAPRASALDELVALVREAAPAYSVVVTAGGRGSGRTTLLRAASDRLGLSQPLSGVHQPLADVDLSGAVGRRAIRRVVELAASRGRGSRRPW